MPHPTILGELKQHINQLACMAETDSPFVSCYINLDDASADWQKLLDNRARILRR